MIAIGWLVAAALLIAGAALIVRRDPRALPVVAIAAFVSLAMCVVGMPEAVLGLILDIVILAGVVLRMRLEPHPLMTVRR